MIIQTEHSDPPMERTRMTFYSVLHFTLDNHIVGYLKVELIETRFR